VKHRFFVSGDQVHGDAVTFSSEQWHQLHTVLRLRIGECVGVFDGVEPVDRRVELVGPSTGRIVAAQPQPPEPRTRLVVYPSLLQRDKFELVLQKLTEVGAAAIAPVLSARALVRQPPDAGRQARWRAQESGREHGVAFTPVVVAPPEKRARVSWRSTLAIQSGPSTIEVVIGATTVRVPAGADAMTLQAVLRVVQALS